MQEPCATLAIQEVHPGAIPEGKHAGQLPVYQDVRIFTANQCPPNFRVAEPEIETNGVDAQRYTPDYSRRAAYPAFAYLGRLKRYKRVDIVIRAFAQLNVAGATLEIAGQGDYRPALEALGRSLDLGERLKFLGFIDENEKVDLLRRAWATVLASPKEGWGISNLESAACGTPVIAGDSPGIRESVINGETGFLVPPSDVPAFAAAMRGLVAQPDLVRTLGEGGRRFAEQFTWERSADETLRHLEQVIAA